MTTELARVERRPSRPGSKLTVPEVVAQAEKIKQAMHLAMEEGIHFGRIPGTPKPTLLKGGAEKLCLLFRLDPQYHSTKTYDGNHLTVESICTLWHIPSGQRFGSGEGSCSTKEKKYAYRTRGADRIANPDLPDQWNTVLKMSNKRALVAAVLNVTAASDVFTQDLEDLEEKPAPAPPPPAKRPDPVNRPAEALRPIPVPLRTEPGPPIEAAPVEGPIPVPEWVTAFDAITTVSAGRALWSSFDQRRAAYTADEQTVVWDAKEAMKQRLMGAA